MYSDITDGSFFREHPELGVEADRSDDALRLGFIIYYDEVEVVNAIGQFAGTHKIGLFYWALLNIGQHERMDLQNIHLATVVLDADVSYYGAEQMVSGPPNEPNWLPCGRGGSSIGASLRALHDGIQLHEPRGATYKPELTRGWLVVVSADNPAAALLTGTMIGTSAVRFCRQCNVDRHKEGFDWPCSFVADAAAPRQSKKAKKTKAPAKAPPPVCHTERPAAPAGPRECYFFPLYLFP